MADPLPPNPGFSLTHAQLAGTSNADGAYNGLEEYGQSLGAERTIIQSDSDASNYTFRCTVVVLAILALLAGGGSAALIYLSNGPASNLPYFVSGCVLGVASLVFLLVGIPIAYSSNSSTLEALNDDLQKKEIAPTHLVDALPKMAKPETTIERIEHVIGRLETPQKRAFIEETYKEYFGEDKPPLEPGQEKVVNAFTACEEALILSIQDPNNDAQFAWNLLKHTDPERLKLTPAVLSALFGAIDAPKNQEEARLLVSFPVQLKMTTKHKIIFGVLEHADTSLNPEVMAAIMKSPRSAEDANHILRHEAALDTKLATPEGRDFALSVLMVAPVDQNENFLDKLFRKVGMPLSESQALVLMSHPKALARNMIVGQENVIANFPKIFADLAVRNSATYTQPVLASIFQHATMTPSNKALFLDALASAEIKDPSLSKKINEIVSPLISIQIAEFIHTPPNPEGFKQLLTAMGNWPHLVAQAIFAKGFAVNTTINHELTVLSTVYNQMKTKNKGDFVTAAAATLRSRQEAFRIYPELIRFASASQKTNPLFMVLAATPELMAKAMNTNGAYTKMAEEVVKTMSPEQKAQLITHLSDPTKILTEDLLVIKKDLKLFPNSVIFNYLKINQGKFKEVVLNNGDLGSEKERGALALNLLEQMGEHAEKIIETLVQRLVGMDFSWYNFLTNMLIDETQINFNKISEPRKLLMARFYHAKAEGRKICDLSWEDQKSTTTQFFDGAKSFLNKLFDESPNPKGNPAKPQDNVDPWKLKPDEEKVWQHFRKAAMDLEARVYIKKS